MKTYKIVLDTNVIVTALRSRKGASFKLLSIRAKRGNKQKFMDALAKVPDIEPEKYDRL